MFGHVPVRRIFYTVSAISFFGIAFLGAWKPIFLLGYGVVIPFIALGLADMKQTRQTIRRNFPILGRGRYLLETIRPEINQYFVESNTDGAPFNRLNRSNVYQRAKQDLNTHPFGTQLDVYEEGYEWLNHSMAPESPMEEELREKIGGADCKQPYMASHLNISAMSFGALSPNAIMALNKGAKLGGFAHNTGEGGLSPYHLEWGGDLIWQIGTGYFGARNPEGTFCPERFADNAQRPSVKMIELKLSQGAKPGHGGILPAEKITPEIAAIRGVSMGHDVVSPPYHTAFKTPLELLHFLAQLRELSGGKPVGMKLCVGHPHEVFAVCKAMLETQIYPDYISVDGGEGGTGAAPLEFSDSVGTPLCEGLILVHNALVGSGLRDKIRVMVGGKVTTGFNVVTKLAMGADFCYSARGFMFALGCIQALQCNSNTCPTGVATQNPELVAGLDITDKGARVFQFHKATIKSFLELIAAAGLTHPAQLNPSLVYRRVTTSSVKSYEDIYHYIEREALIDGFVPPDYKEHWTMAQSTSFQPRSGAMV